MSRRTPSPKGTDQDMMLDYLIENKGNTFDLTDKDEFNAAWESYFGTFEDDGFAVSLKVRNQVYERSIFRAAGGKNLTQDRLKTSKTVVTTKEEYIDKTSQRTDLEGLDTKRRN